MTNLSKRGGQKLVAGIFLATTLMLPGCGGGSGEDDDAGGPPVAVPPPVTTPPSTSPPATPPPAGTPPAPALPDDLRTASMVIEPTLLAQVKEVSSIEATILPGQPITFPVGIPGVAIAHNASGSVVALGSSAATSATVDLSAAESASTLVWMQLGGPLLKTPITEVKARISQAPEFSELVAVVHSSSALEAGILREEVFAVVDKLMAGLSAPEGSRTAGYIVAGGAVSTAPALPVRADFLPKNLIGIPKTGVAAARDVDAASRLKMLNAGGLEWRAESIPMVGGNTKPAYSMLLPASEGFLTFGMKEISLPLSSGDQFVRVFQNDETRRENWKKIWLDALFYGLGFAAVPPVAEAQIACALEVAQSASGVKLEDFTSLSASTVALQFAVSTLRGMLKPTTIKSVLSCAGYRVGRIVNPSFARALSDIILRATVLKITDGFSLANRVTTLVMHNREEHGEQMSVCVAKGTVVAQECDVRGTFVVNVVQTGKTVAPPSDVPITIDGVPMIATIFCEADDSARGEQRISLVGLAATNRVTARFMGEDIPTAGIYDYDAGTFDITYVTPVDLAVGSPAVSFYDQQRYRIKGTVDLRTGRIQGTFEDTNVVSWTLNGMTKECTSTYSFEGDMAPGST